MNLGPGAASTEIMWVQLVDSDQELFSSLADVVLRAAVHHWIPLQDVINALQYCPTSPPKSVEGDWAACVFAY